MSELEKDQWSEYLESRRAGDLARLMALKDLPDKGLLTVRSEAVSTLIDLLKFYIEPIPSRARVNQLLAWGVTPETVTCLHMGGTQAALALELLEGYIRMPQSPKLARGLIEALTRQLKGDQNT